MKKQITFRIDEELIDKVRDIVYANRNLSLNSAIEYSLNKLVEEYGVGVPKRNGELLPGRKIG